jgi:molybdopterin synthase sulfur carrier subunit
MLTIKYFGLLAEITQCNEEQIEFSGNLVNELLDTIFFKHSGLRDKDFQVAQSQVIISKKAEISENEIALLPPFSGG